jgi:hypothetical protein
MEREKEKIEGQTIPLPKEKERKGKQWFTNPIQITKD